MILALSIYKLQQIITSAVDAGIQAYERELTPGKDRIKKGEAKRLIQRYGFQPVMIDKWSELHLLKSEKSSDSQNAARWYSVAEIKALIATIKLKEACNESHISYTIKPKQL